jgi:hypothetical protein
MDGVPYRKKKRSGDVDSGGLQIGRWLVRFGPGHEDLAFYFFEFLGITKIKGTLEKKEIGRRDDESQTILKT